MWSLLGSCLPIFVQQVAYRSFCDGCLIVRFLINKKSKHTSSLNMCQRLVLQSPEHSRLAGSGKLLRTEVMQEASSAILDY
jgi:hypothetical protein